MFADRTANLRGTNSCESLERVLNHYRESGWQADLAIVTGDIVQDDSAGGYERFRALLSELHLPVYCLPGNHDVELLMREALSDPPFRYCESLESNGWLIVNVDSCVSGQAGGEVSATELERVETEILSTRAAHVLVCLHHPPVSMGSQWLDAVGLANAEKFMSVISASGKVRLVLFGHVHQAHESEHDGIRIVGTPSTCRQFAQGSDSFAVDDKPPAYRLIRLYTDGRFEHELTWVQHEPFH